MDIGVPKEVVAGERRVALVPESVARLVAAGHRVMVEVGAGSQAHFADCAYTDAGAQIAPDAGALYAQAELVLKVQAPTGGSAGGDTATGGPVSRDATTADSAQGGDEPVPAQGSDEPVPAQGSDEMALLRMGTILVGLLQPLVAPERIRLLAERGITAFSMDAIPRITRAQGMDVLSSMSTVAGYRATLIGATLLGRFFPLLMTAAGTVTPARVLVLGAGVAGLQAIATAKRLGAVVQAFDTRPVVREQVESLGASFLTLELHEEQTEAAGGYARELAEETYAHERDLLREPVREADVIITTAMIPGARAPVLITEEMVATMREGSVIVDLAAPSGGNCAVTVPGRQTMAHGVVVEGPLNLPATMPVHASQLYSRNLLAFVTHLLANGVVADVEDGGWSINMDDEIVRSTCVAHGGRVRP